MMFALTLAGEAGPATPATNRGETGCEELMTWKYNHHLLRGRCCCRVKVIWEMSVYRPAWVFRVPGGSILTCTARSKRCFATSARLRKEDEDVYEQ
jgi:hypothetical protein